MSFFESKVRFLLYVASVSLVSTSPSLNLIAASPAYSIEDKEEAFLVRRISEFWKDQDYPVVKEQIISFLEKYPKSKINDHLRGILGDLYLQENAYEDAFALYSQIQSTPITEKILLNKLQCMYELSLYESMIAVSTPFIGKSIPEIESRKDEFKFLMGEAYFRNALSLDNPSKKLDSFSKAEPFYEAILTSSFNDPAMFALAEIYKAKKENVKAANFYLQLADRHPDKKEDLLFHAALAQAEFDKNAAISSFDALIAKKGAKASDAEFNKLILLFQQDRFNDVIAAYPKMIGTISKDKEDVVNYMVGRSYFAEEQYENSSIWLKKYILTTVDPTLELRNALLMQLNTAQTLKNEVMYHESMTLLQTVFPKDAELPQALFVHAMMLKDQGDLTGAEMKLEEIVQNHPNFENTDSLLLEYAIVAHGNQNYEKSYESLSQFLKKYPDSQYAPSAWKYLLSCGLNLLKLQESGIDVDYMREDLYDDIKTILAQKDALIPTERQECLFLQGKLGYELGKYSEALSTLHTYLSTYSNDQTLPEAHLLTALCHNKIKGDAKLFCEHAEAALKGNPNLTNKSSIHLELYNVYLSTLSQGKSTGKENALYDLAAEHLFQAVESGDLPIKLENRLWLANYYYDKTANLPQIFEIDGSVPGSENSPVYNRSKSLLQKILTQGNSLTLNPIDKDHTFLEWEVLKLANISGREKNYEKKIHLLQGLIEEQINHPDWNWKLQKEALLELAKSYEITSQYDNSYDTYKFIVDHFRKEPSFVSEYAVLQAARLKFATLKPDQRSETNPEVIKILGNLKELQIRKSPLSEPLHLEAALEYAWIRAQIANEDERAFRYAFFLNRIKEDFNDMDDPMVSSYHKNLKDHPEKAKLYATYAKFLDAELARCNACLANQANKPSEAIESSEKAKTILSSFITPNESSYYLKIRAEESLEALKKSKIT
jgi:tetratricopeptide (TPR) repeat protein